MIHLSLTKLSLKHESGFCNTIHHNKHTNLNMLKTKGRWNIGSNKFLLMFSGQCICDTYFFFYVERLCSSKSFCVPSFVLGLFYCHINSKHTHTTEFLLRPCCSLKNFRAILQMQTCALEMAKGPRLQHAAKVLVENGLKMRNHISEEMGDGAKPHVTVIVKCQ